MPGGNWPPDTGSDKSDRDGVSALLMHAEAIAAQDAIDFPNRKTAEPTSVTPSADSVVAPEPRASALRDHADIVLSEETAVRTRATQDATPKELKNTLKQNIASLSEQSHVPSIDTGAVENLTQTEAKKRAQDALRNATATTDGETLAEEKARLVGRLKETVRTKAIPTEAVPNSRAAYESRVNVFAENNGLSAEFSAVQAARETYRTARLSGTKEGSLAAKKEYDSSLFALRQSLETFAGGYADLSARVAKTNEARVRKGVAPEKGAGLSDTEKFAYQTQMEALVFSKRETILGPASLELEIRQEKFSEKQKTTFGKVENWLKSAPLSALRLTNMPFEGIGAFAANRLHKDPQARADAARLYTRAARILAGAGIATGLAIAASPVTVPGALLTLAIYGARGTIGTLAGVGSAKAAGSLFDRWFGSKQKAGLKASLRSTPTTIEEYQMLQETYRKQNTSARSSQRAVTQMLAAVVGGAGTGFLTSPIAHTMIEQLSAHSGVAAAARTVAETNANASEAATQAARIAARAGEHTPTAASTESIVGTAPVPGAQAPLESITQTPAAPLAASPSVGEHAPIAAPAAIGEHAPIVAPSISGEGIANATVGRGEGFGELIQHFRHNLSAGQPGLESTSPAIAHLMHGNANDISRELAALRSDGSMTMHQGDQLYADAKGDVWFKPQGGDAQRLFENNASLPGGYESHVFAHDVPVTSDHTASDSVRPTVDQVPQTSAPEDPSTSLNRNSHGGTVAPEPAPVRTEPVPEAPKAPTAPTPETVSAPTPSGVDAVQPPSPSEFSGANHYFADPSTPGLVNAHGVDLNVPQLLKVDGRIFAHGTSIEDSYNRAAAYSSALAAEHAPDTRVFFVTRELDALQQPYLAVRMVFTPTGSVPQMAPYGEGLTVGPEFEVPAVPKDSQYELLKK